MRVLILISLLFTTCSIDAQTITVGSYNIRQANAQDSLAGNSWSRRCPVQVAMIRYYDFDILGAQEVIHRQLMDLLESLPEYNYIGVGRDDGKTRGEYSPIFYKKDRFNLLQSGHFWLAEDPTQPIKGWDAAYVRICTWGQFQDKTTNQIFWAFSLHTDHIGTIARQETSKLILRKIQEMCANNPVFITGDFNVDQHDESYKMLIGDGVLVDSYEIAHLRYALNGTVNHFDPNKMTDQRIDHIFVSNGIIVTSYAVLTDTYRAQNNRLDWIPKPNSPIEGKPYESCIRMPSDHFPVRIVANFTTSNR